jgi:hypothetical protein
MKREFRKWEIKPPKGPYLTIKFSRPVPEALARQFGRQLLGTGNLPDRTRVEPTKETGEPPEEPAPYC